MTHRTIFFIILGVFIIVLVSLAGTYNSGNHDAAPAHLPDNTTQVADTPAIAFGKSCGSVEEWHAAAEKKGAWAGGILVSQSMTDAEILSLLAPYNLMNHERIRIYRPHAFGYYVVLNASQDNTLSDTNPFFNETPGIGFPASMYSVLEPVKKRTNGTTAVPVMLYFGSDDEKTALINEIARHNVSLYGTRIVYLGDVDQSGREERESRLQDLNRNPEVLFAFKEYLQDDMC